MAVVHLIQMTDAISVETGDTTLMTATASESGDVEAGAKSVFFFFSSLFSQNLKANVCLTVSVSLLINAFRFNKGC